MLKIPTWYRVACEFAIIRPSSATVERIFSLYESAFSNLQQNALQDYRETAIMLQFNEYQRSNNEN
jgi:hypothetical protein